jgi:putative acetyltransferase
MSSNAPLIELGYDLGQWRVHDPPEWSEMGIMDNEIRIRAFEADDRSAFQRLNEQWINQYFRLEPKDLTVLGDPQREIIRTGGHILIAVSRDEAVGCCALVPHGTDCFEVSKMAVSEPYKGKGVGRGLLTEVIQLARALGAKRVYLETNRILTPAIRLYESVGFRHVPPERVTRSPFKRADVFMELFLG